MSEHYLGQEGRLFFVNSATGLSRDRVDGLFPEGAADGSIDIGIVETEIGGTVVPGTVAIRSKFQELSLQYRPHAYTKQQANRLLKPLLSELPEWREAIPYCEVASLHGLAKEAVRQGDAAHKRVLKDKARRKRW